MATDSKTVEELPQDGTGKPHRQEAHIAEGGVFMRGTRRAMTTVTERLLI